MPTKMCLNTLIQWRKIEVTRKLQRTYRNLLEVHYKIQNQVNDKLINALAPMLDVSASTKYHYWFALFLDPRYVIKLKDIKTFCQSENVDTKQIVQKMMPKLYDHIMAAELDVNTSTPNILVDNSQ